MKKSNYLTVCCALLCTHLLLGQVPSTSAKFKRTGFSLSTGVENNLVLPLFIQDGKIYKRFAFGRDSRFDNFSIFRTLPRRFDFTLEFEKQQSEDVMHRMRFGLGFKTRNLYGYSNHTVETTKYDTLYTATGEQKIIDSTSSVYHTDFFFRTTLRLDFSYLIHHQAKQRLSYYYGLGANLGTSIFDQQINREETSIYGSQSTSGIKINPGLSTQLFIPFGLDFCLNQKSVSKFQYLLFAEGRIGIQNQSYKGYGSETNLIKSIQFGIRLKRR